VANVTGIFYGDLVTRVTGGTIEKDTGTATADTVWRVLRVYFY
jgi:hypothetical protein